MSTLQIKDGAGVTKYLAGSGAGTIADPFITRHTNEATVSTMKVVTVVGQSAGTTIWLPAAGFHIDLRSFHFTFQTGTNTNDSVGILEYYTGGIWLPLIRLGDKKSKFVSGHHSFVGHVSTDDGDGASARIRVVVTGTDTDMVSSVMIEGAEV